VQATVDPCHKFAAQPSQLDSHSSCFNFFHPYISILTAPPSLSHIHDRFVTSDTQSISSIPLHCDLADDRSRPSRQYQLPNPSIATTSCAQGNPAWLFPLRPPGLSWNLIPLCSRRRSLDSEVLGVSSTPVHLSNSLHPHWNPLYETRRKDIGADYNLNRENENSDLTSVRRSSALDPSFVIKSRLPAPPKVCLANRSQHFNSRGSYSFEEFGAGIEYFAIDHSSVRHGRQDLHHHMRRRWLWCVELLLESDAKS
jgi:hypothetical protein